LKDAQQDLSIVQNELTETQQELSSKSDWISPQDLAQQKETWETLKSSEMSEFQKKLESKESQIQELQAECSSLQEEFDQMVIDEGKTKETLQQKLGEMTRLYEQCVVDKELLQQEVRQVHQDSFDLKNKVSSLQKQLDDQQSTWISPETAQHTAESYEGNINSLKSQLLEQLEIIETLQLKVTEQQEAIAMATAAAATAAAEAAAREADGSNESSERDEKLDLSLIQLEKFKDMIQTLKEKNLEMEERNESNEKLIAEKIQLIRKLEQEKTALSSVGYGMQPQQQLTPAESGSANGSKFHSQTLNTAAPILFFEIGSFVTRIGIWRETHFVPWYLSLSLSSHPPFSSSFLSILILLCLSLTHTSLYFSASLSLASLVQLSLLVLKIKTFQQMT
jgi:hypothetical protein